MKNNRKEQRQIRHMRLRQKVKGTADRPRMAIFISNKHMYVQFVDDAAHMTLAHVTTIGSDTKVNVASAKVIGEKAAAAAKDKKIEKVVIDRGGFRFHGRVKAIVDAAVAGGIKISDKPPKVREEKIEKKPEAKKEGKEGKAPKGDAPKGDKPKKEKA